MWQVQLDTTNKPHQNENPIKTMGFVSNLEGRYSRPFIQLYS